MLPLLQAPAAAVSRGRREKGDAKVAHFEKNMKMPHFFNFLSGAL